MDNYFLRSTTYDVITATTRSCIVYANGRFQGSGGLSSGDEEAERRTQRGLKGFNLSDDEPTLISLHLNERPLRGAGHRNAAHLAENGAQSRGQDGRQLARALFRNCG